MGPSRGVREDRALVIGCDHYPDLPKGSLRGAVRDALAFRDWLLRPDGGALTPSQVALLASPVNGISPDLSSSDVDGPASLRSLSRQVRELIESGPGRRLYVYFAGHGCRTHPENKETSQDAILLTDFTPDNVSIGSVDPRGLLDRLTMAALFEEIVMMVDACRNAPFKRPFRPCGLGEEPEPRPLGTPPPRSFFLQATQPGEAAGEEPYGGQHGGVIRGVFSVALLDALGGVGKAKIFDSTDATGQPYRVLPSGLCGYLAGALPNWQTPEFHLRSIGSSDDLVLATFPEGAFPPVTLTVEVEGSPAAAAPDDLRVTARWDIQAAGPDGCLERPGPAPVQLKLPPRQHRVTAFAGTHQGKCSVDLYTDDKMWITLEPPAPGIRFQKSRSQDQVQGDAVSSMSIITPSASMSIITPSASERPFTPSASERPFTPSASERTQRVRLTADDPAAVLELRTTGGTMIAREIAELDVVVPVGWYTAVALGEAGRELRQLVGAESGSPTLVVELNQDQPVAWPPRSSPLEWSSPAAWVAGSGWGPRGWGLWPGWPRVTGHGTVALAEQATQTTEQATQTAGQAGLTAVPTRDNRRAPHLLTRLETASGPSHELEAAGTRLVVPALPDVLTSVVVSESGLCVRLYDLALFNDPVSVLWLDRAQDLLACGRAESALTVLSALRDRHPTSRVADALRILADGREVMTGALLGGRPWRVTVKVK